MPLTICPILTLYSFGSVQSQQTNTSPKPSPHHFLVPSASEESIRCAAIIRRRCPYTLQHTYTLLERIAGYPPMSTNRMHPRPTYLKCLDLRETYIRPANVEDNRVYGNVPREVVQSLSSQGSGCRLTRCQCSKRSVFKFNVLHQNHDD